MNNYRIIIQSPNETEIWRDCNLEEMDSEKISDMVVDMFETLTQEK